MDHQWCPRKRPFYSFYGAFLLERPPWKFNIARWNSPVKAVMTPWNLSRGSLPRTSLTVHNALFNCSYLIEEMVFLDCVKVTIFWRVAKNDNHSVSYHMCRVAHTEKELKFWYFVLTYWEKKKIYIFSEYMMRRPTYIKNFFKVCTLFSKNVPNFCRVLFIILVRGRKKIKVYIWSDVICIHKIQWFTLSRYICWFWVEKPCFLGPTIFKIPQLNWY